MPEGHTIHRLARDLNRTLRPGPVEASSPQGRFADGAAELDGLTLAKAEAWGKHLFLDFEDGPMLHIHLGLIGKLRRKPAGAPEKGAIRLRMSNEDVTWDLTGPMACELIVEDDLLSTVEVLGPDPLRADSDVDRFREKLGRKRSPIAGALLDQGVIAGIGNVYRSEFLYLLGIDPETPANELTPEQVDELWKLSVEHLTEGVRLNRIVTRDPSEVGVAAGRIPRPERLYVYKRGGMPCRRCGDEIVVLDVGQRKAWKCPTCQT